jgi:hypothetical protein
MGDFKAEFNDKVSALIDAVKDGAYADRCERLTVINELIDEYVTATDETPDSTQLERLTNLCLYEELHDDTAWKSRQYEYPFFSEFQLARRQEGKHTRRSESGQREIGINKAWSIGTDKRDYAIPTRRERSNNENIFMDAEVKSRNKERRRKYREFTKIQPVHTRQMTVAERERLGWL